mgnify:CR=1 FL=1
MEVSTIWKRKNSSLPVYRQCYGPMPVCTSAHGPIEGTGCLAALEKEQLYEGKAKKVFATEDPNLVIVSYKDDATAFDGTKKGTIRGKGAVNNRMSNFLMGKLSAAGIPTHFVEELNDREPGTCAAPDSAPTFATRQK